MRRAVLEKKNVRRVVLETMNVRRAVLEKNNVCSFKSIMQFCFFLLFFTFLNFFYFHCSLKAMSLVKCIGGDKQRTLLLLTYAKKYTFRGRNFLAPMTTTAAIFLISTCYIYANINRNWVMVRLPQ